MFQKSVGYRNTADKLGAPFLKKLHHILMELLSSEEKTLFEVQPVLRKYVQGEFAVSMEIWTIVRAVDPARALFRIRDPNN